MIWKGGTVQLSTKLKDINPDAYALVPGKQHLFTLPVHCPQIPFQAALPSVATSDLKLERLSHTGYVAMEQYVRRVTGTAFLASRAFPA